MTTRLSFEPRKMMEKAIEIMQSSVPEKRTDGKPTPLVGAVLVRPDGSIETAARGELREGNHAEFTLLERKCPGEKLDDCVLFATLEPCLDRNHPKRGCARHIVGARIKEVWIGIEDPDPTVDRKGIKFLQDRGVVVNMFDRDLQDRIRALNQEFLRAAIDRRTAAEESKESPRELSVFENALPATAVTDLAGDVLESYRRRAGLEEAVDSGAFRHRLLRQGLLKQDGHRFVPSGFGVLLFGKSPRDAMPQAGVLATIHYPDGSEETRDFDAAMVLVPEQVIQWLKDKLPNPINRSGARREELTAGFYELVREGIVNALVHRDYSITGAKCQLVITNDTVAIRSPGEPVAPITLVQLQSLQAPMLSRNPMLHYVFARMELAEERGLGLKSFKNRTASLGLQQPKYSWHAPYLTLTFFRSADAALRDRAPDFMGQLTYDEKATWQFILSQGRVRSQEVMAKMGFTERKSQRVLRKLVLGRLIRPVGKGPSTQYVVNPP